MSRSPIQVPDETKEEMEVLKDKLHVKSLHELISLLMKSHKDFQQFKVDESKRREAEKKRQQLEMVQLGGESKKKFVEIKEELKLDQDSSVFEFLREHYQNSKEISNTTFMYYRSLK